MKHREDNMDMFSRLPTLWFDLYLTSMELKNTYPR